MLRRTWTAPTAPAARGSRTAAHEPAARARRCTRAHRRRALPRRRRDMAGVGHAGSGDRPRRLRRRRLGRSFHAMRELRSAHLRARRVNDSGLMALRMRRLLRSRCHTFNRRASSRARLRRVPSRLRRPATEQSCTTAGTRCRSGRCRRARCAPIGDASHGAPQADPPQRLRRAIASGGTLRAPLLAPRPPPGTASQGSWRDARCLLG
jgi:hypothetical protein